MRKLKLKVDVVKVIGFRSTTFEVHASLGSRPFKNRRDALEALSKLRRDLKKIGRA